MEQVIYSTIWRRHEVVQQAIKDSKSIKEVLNRLGLNSVWGAHGFVLFHEYVREHKIDLSHFNANSIRAQKTVQRGRRKIAPLSEILHGEHPSYPTTKLAKRLIAEGIFEKKCMQCNLVDWLGKPISLHLDHIDGNKRNHRLENLRLLCPNCHSQTETYAGHNKKANGRRTVSDTEFLGALLNTPNIHAALLYLGLQPTGGNYQRAKVLGERFKNGQLDFGVNGPAKIDKPGRQPKELARKPARARDAQEKINLVKASGIDFSKFGWVTRAAKVLAIKPQKVHLWMKRWMPEFYVQHCFKRRSQKRAARS